MKIRYRKYLVLCLLVLAAIVFTIDAMAAGLMDQSPVVRAIFFYSPTCGHCHKVINEDLPPLIEKYGDQLQLMGINVATQEGSAIFQEFLVTWEIPEDRFGVPALVVGDEHLVGSAEIPQFFPGIIAEGLQSGGIDWPDIPGLPEVLAQAKPTPTEPGDPVNSQSSSDSLDFPMDMEVTVADRFKQDLAGNILAVVTLVGMVVSIVWVLISVLSANITEGKDWSWLIPVLSILGLFVAGYLSFVEVTHTEAVCGPVGDCNSVQQSPYARLFGILPVGILGLMGYILILISWVLKHHGPETWRETLTLAIWGMALFGVIFSIYLTYLEPFVIGATCIWCISSAIIITLQMWAATGPVREIWAEADNDEDDEI